LTSPEQFINQHFELFDVKDKDDPYLGTKNALLRALSDSYNVCKDTRQTTLVRYEDGPLCVDAWDPDAFRRVNEVRKFLGYHINYMGQGPKFYRDAYCLNSKRLEFMARAYWRWVLDQEQGVFEKFDEDYPGYLISALPKRGNEEYCKNMRTRVEAMFAKYEPIFSKVQADSSRCYFVSATLTYDPKDISRNDAWMRVTKDINNYLSRLRKGWSTKTLKHIRPRVWIVSRVVESHLNGYPHPHILLCFKTGLACKRSGKERKIWFYPHVFSYMKNAWVHGNTKMQGINTLEGAINHTIKYFMKSTETMDPVGVDETIDKYFTYFYTSTSTQMKQEILRKEEQTIIKWILTNALNWFFNKRGVGFSVKRENKDGSLTGFFGHLEMLWECAMVAKYGRRPTLVTAKRIDHLKPPGPGECEGEDREWDFLGLCIPRPKIPPGFYSKDRLKVERISRIELLIYEPKRIAPSYWEKYWIHNT